MLALRLLTFLKLLRRHKLFKLFRLVKLLVSLWKLFKLYKPKIRKKVEGMPKWRCTVCGYIHEGENPPEVCPLCGVGAEEFEKVEEESSQQKEVAVSSQIEAAPPMDKETALKHSLFAISYGLFIITAHADGVDNGQCANTCFQITSDPPQIAIGINKSNYTHELISKSGKFGVSILNQQGHDYARRFGYSSGRDGDKFAGLDNVHRGELGILLLDDCLATMEAEVVGTLDAGTHTLFLGEVKNGEVLQKGEPMTYAYFRATR